MGKQKIVMRVSMEDAKKRTKALQTAVGLPGVLSAKLEGDDRIEVVADGTDSITLTIKLRKKMGFAELVSVGEDKKEEKKEEKSVEPVVWSYPTMVVPSMAQPYLVPANNYDPYCCIL